MLESVYEDALAWELRHRGLHVDRRLKVPIVYKGNNPGDALRLDLLVEGRVIIEVKSVTAYNPVFEAQALTYLRLMGLKLALVINFGERLVRDGIHRVVNGL